jgi:hypothetical protein
MNKSAKKRLITIIALNAFTAILLVLLTVKVLNFNPSDLEQKDLADLAKTLSWYEGHGLFPLGAVLTSFTTYLCWRVLANSKKDESKRGLEKFEVWGCPQAAGPCEWHMAWFIPRLPTPASRCLPTSRNL